MIGHDGHTLMLAHLLASPSYNLLHVLVGCSSLVLGPLCVIGHVWAVLRGGGFASAVWWLAASLSVYFAALAAWITWTPGHEDLDFVRALSAACALLLPLTAAWHGLRRGRLTRGGATTGGKWPTTVGAGDSIAMCVPGPRRSLSFGRRAGSLG